MIAGLGPLLGSVEGGAEVLEGTILSFRLGLLLASKGNSLGGWDGVWERSEIGLLLGVLDGLGVLEDGAGDILRGVVGAVVACSSLGFRMTKIIVGKRVSW